MRRWLATAILSLSLATPALAAPGQVRATRVAAPAAAQGTRITIDLVVARDAGPVDPGLEGIARQLRSRGLTSVRRVDTVVEKVDERGVITASVDGRRMRVKLLSLGPTEARLDASAHRDGEELFHQSFTAPRGKVSGLFGMGSYRGGKLFAAITVGR